MILPYPARRTESRFAIEKSCHLIRKSCRLDDSVGDLVVQTLLLGIYDDLQIAIMRIK